MINSFKDLAALIQGCNGDTTKVDWHEYGQVSVKQQDDLILFSYARECQFKKPAEWNWFEKVSRGLVMNVKGEVVARPFDKFWNLGEAAPVQGTRKDFALWVKQQDKSLQKFLFLYYDKKLTDGIIAKYISELY